MLGFEKIPIKHQLLAVGAIAVVPALAIILWSGYERRRDAVARAEEDCAHYAAVLGSDIAGVAGSCRLMFETLVNFPEIRNADPFKCGEVFSEIVRNNTHFLSFTAARPDGELFAAGAPLMKPVSVGDRKWFRDALRRRAFSAGECVISRTAHQPIFSFSYPVYASSGGLVSVFQAGIDLNYIGELVRQRVLPVGVSVTVTDWKGTIVMQSGRHALTGSETDDPLMFQRMKVAAKSHGVGRLDDGGHLNAFRSLRLSDDVEPYMYVRVAMPTESILGPIMDITYRHLMWFVVAAAFALGVAWIIGDRIVGRRVSALVAFAQRIATVDQEWRWELPVRGGELGVLADALKELSHSLSRTLMSLRESERRFRGLVETTSDWIWETDADGKYTYVSPQVEAILGYTAEEVLGKHPMDFMPASESSRLTPILEDIWSRKARLNRMENRNLHKDGREIVLETSGVAILDPKGNLLGYRGIDRDVTERKRAEAAIALHRSMLVQVLDSIPQGVFWKNQRSIYLGCNKVFARGVGLSRPEDVLGKTDYDLRWAGRDIESHLAADREVMDKGITKDRILEEIQTADGRRRWVETSKVPLRESSGRVYGVLGVYEDITDRKEAEAALRQSEEHFRTLFEAITDGVFVCEIGADGHMGRFLEVNEASCRRFGYSRDELLRMTPLDLDAADSGVDAEGVTRRLLGGEAVAYESIYVGKDSARIPVDIRSRLFTFSKRRVVLSLVRDISERKQAESERLKVEQQLQHSQRLESLGVLAGGIAHDFNNLLTSILGNASLALMDIEPAAQESHYLHDIEEAARRAADLCRQMLACAGKAQFIIENVRLNEMIEGMTGLLRSSIPRKAFLNMQLASGLPEIRGDAAQIRQVIINLVLNASEAIGDGEGSITIATGISHCTVQSFAEAHGAESCAEGQYVWMGVEDTGCGMDAETQRRVFEPFFSTKFTGRGLGLSTVLGVMRGHGGAVKVESVRGKGALFRVFFPVLPEATLKLRSKDAGWRGSGVVLLVDDELDVRVVGKKLLEKLGFSVITAVDGMHALEVYREQAALISLVLLDLTMPRMSGAEAYVELRKITPPPRVVMMSGYSESDVARRFSGEASVCFLQKPFDLEDLRERLRETFLGDGVESGGCGPGRT